ncbi:MAG: tRNA threonylcarbamoyladenosine dehydratase [Armatimonadia bacterium]
MTTPEQFRRLEMMVGEAGLARLRAAFVCVIGLGAVGSYATEALARAGIGRLRLVDFDLLRASNLNRQLYALHSTIGRPKCEVAAERVLDINPDCQVEPLKVFVHAETMDEVLQGPPDLVIDAIDSYAPKLELLCALCERGIPLLSSMGAALRTEPSRVQVATIEQTQVCPLARRLRKGLRQRGVTTDLPCVYSDEPVDKSRIHPPEPRQADDLDRGRERRSLGSLPTMTGLFGLTVANEALQMILGNRGEGARGVEKCR